jgi:hypothetical protein
MGYNGPPPKGPPSPNRGTSPPPPPKNPLSTVMRALHIVDHNKNKDRKESPPEIPEILEKPRRKFFLD